MKRIILPLVLLLINSFLSRGQTTLKSGKYEMAYILNGNNVGVIDVDIISISNNRLAICAATHIQNSNDVRLDTTIVDAATLAPGYRSSSNKKYNLKLQYGKEEVTGYYLDKQTGKKTVIKEQVTGAIIDDNCLQYYLTTLPLATGYTGNVNLYNYKPNSPSNIKKLIIGEVKNNYYTSKLTGQHKVWELTASQEGSNDNSVYYIDKDTRRLWEIEFNIGGLKGLFVDKEIEYSRYHYKFDKEATLKLIKDGKSVIQGQVFTRGDIKNLELKKRIAQQGTTVQLIPYTDFFKEWLEVEDKGYKTGQWAGWVPLSEDQKKCIKSTQIFDKDGHFEFTNLMPGDYLLRANFFTTKHLSHEEDSYSNVYINGNYVGTEKSGISIKNDGTGFSAKSVSKVVTVKQDGETVTVKLN